MKLHLKSAETVAIVKTSDLARNRTRETELARLDHAAPLPWPDDPGFREGERVAQVERERERRIREWHQKMTALIDEAAELGISPDIHVHRVGRKTDFARGANDTMRQRIPYVDRTSRLSKITRRTR